MIARSRETPRRSPDPGLRVEPGIGQKTFQIILRAPLGQFRRGPSDKIKMPSRRGGDQAATIHLKSLSDYTLLHLRP
jgi:hypothetical protein